MRKVATLGRPWPCCWLSSRRLPSMSAPTCWRSLVGIVGYVVLATAWALFSGPTRYISLATVAFFGIGAYTVAVLQRNAALSRWCCWSRR